MAQRATYDLKTAPLHEEFGREWAEKLFGADTIAALPRYERGPHKGKLKGFVKWTRVRSGGWDPDQGVLKGGVAEAWITNSPTGTKTEAITGTWLGTTMPLRLQQKDLFDEGRSRKAAEMDALRGEQLQEILIQAEHHGFVDGTLGTTQNRYACLETTYPGVSAAWEKGRAAGAASSAEVPAHMIDIMRRMAANFYPKLPEDPIP